MKNLFISLLLIVITFKINAQVLSEADLATVNVNNIIAMEQMKFDSDNAFSSAFVTVGSDTACNYKLGNSKIQDAINAGHTEIRIAQGTYAENVVIDNRNVKLLGGYETCTDANNDSVDGQFASIAPNTGSGQPSLKITGSSTRNYVVLRNIVLRNGEALGGLAIRDADLGLTLDNVTINQNSGDYGGGLSVVNGHTDIHAVNPFIGQNIANVVGGGLYCRGSNNNIIIEREGNTIVGIRDNQAPN